MDADADHAAGRQRRERLLVAAGLIAVLLLAFFVRTYRLSAQSVWWDDYNGLIGLRADNLPVALELARRYNPQSTPVYFTIQYFYSRLFGIEPATIRFLSVLFGLLTVPLIYLLGREVHGMKAGLIAALCFALSPIHLYHDQSIRLYPLFVLLATCSLLALLKAMRGHGWWWWIVNFAFNALLAWTHLFAVVLVFTEGCYLVVCLARLRWKTAVWLMIHGLCLVPTIQYARTMPYVEDEGYDHFTPPPLKEIFFDLVGDDALGTAYQIIPHGNTWAFVSPERTQSLARARPSMDRALLLALSLCVAWLLGRIGYWAWRRYRVRDERATLESVYGWVLVLFVWALPVLILSTLSYLWRPCIYPRYTVYSSIALYVIVGAAVQSIPLSVLRKLGVAVIVILYGYQLSFVIPAATRTDWYGAVDHIKSKASPDDIILVGGPGPAYPHINIFSFHMGYTQTPIIPAHTHQAVCDKSVCFFKQRAAASPESRATGTPGVWAVLQRGYGYGPMPDLERGLTANGLAYEARHFLAMEKISVYHITPGPRFYFSRRTPAAPIQVDVDFPQILEDLGVVYADKRKQDEMVAIMRRVIDFPRPIDVGDLAVSSSWLTDEGAVELEIAGGKKLLEQNPQSALAHVKLTWAYLAQGEVAKAVDVGRKAIELSPGDSGAHLALSFALFKLGDRQAAIDEADRAVDLDSFFIRRHKPLLTAMYEDHDYERARQEAFKLRAMHGYLPRAVMTELGLDSSLTTCPLPVEP